MERKYRGTAKEMVAVEGIHEEEGKAKAQLNVDEKDKTEWEGREG